MIKLGVDGPIWIDKLNDMNFVRILLQEMTSEKSNFEFRTKKKIIGMLYAILYDKHYQHLLKTLLYILFKGRRGSCKSIWI